MKLVSAPMRSKRVSREHCFYLALSMQVGDQKFTAHRIVLAATIPYFHAMFTHDMAEATQNEITMQGIDPG